MVKRPLIPRCMSRLSPPSRPTRRYLARRPTVSMRRPASRRAKPSGKGTRKSSRFSSTFSIRRPIMALSRPRRTVSTSGSSGMATSWQGFAAPSSGFSTDSNVNGARRWSAPMADRPSNRRLAPFGDADVEASEKQTMVNEVFAKVASKYDQMNDLMSFGLHRLWKDDLVAMLNPPRSPRGFEVLDLAGGTGDIALRIARAGGSGVRVTVADISPAMLGEGRRRIGRERPAPRCRFAVTNAEALAFRSGTFDAVTIAFGIRNVTDIGRALGEARRVLKPGGRFLCLEFSRVDVPGVEAFYDLYSLTTIPALGKIVTGDGQPYRYLVESIRRFPEAASFARKIEQAGFSQVSFRMLSAGVVAIHSGWRT